MSPDANRRSPLASSLVRRVLAVVLVALVVRCALFVAVQPWNEHVVERTILAGDAAGYHSLALGILESGSFESYGALRTPAYPVFVSAVYSLAGPSVWAVLLIQMVLNVASVIMVYALGKMAFDERVALIAALLYALDIQVALYSVNLLSETLLVFVILVSSLALMRGLQRERAAWLLLAGLFLGLAALVKPVAQYLPFLAVALILLYPRIGWSLRLGGALGLTLVFALTISPWLYRNHVTYGHWSLSTVPRTNLLYCNVALAEATRTGRTLQDVRAELAAEAESLGASPACNPFDNCIVYGRVAAEHVKANPAAFARSHAGGIPWMFLNLDTSTMCRFLGLESRAPPFSSSSVPPSVFRRVSVFLETRSHTEIAVGIVMALFLLLSYAALFVSTASMIRAGKHALLLAILAVPVYFVLLTGGMGSARFKLPIVPFCALVSANGLSAVLKTLAKRRARGAAGSREHDLE